MRIQHPRATDRFSRDPPASVTLAGRRRLVDSEGYADVGEDGKAAMSELAAAYDVEYDDDGNVVVDSDDSDGEDEDGLEEGDVVLKEETEPEPEEVTCAGPNGEGNCSRPVESEGDRCWQHLEE